MSLENNMPLSLKHYQSFIGKICTVSTVQINFRYKEEAMMAYFMGYVESVDASGIMLVHPQSKCKSFIAMPHIVAVSEEQVLYEDNPADAKLIQEYRKDKPLTAEKYAIPAKESINPDALADIVKKAKEALAGRKP